MLRWTTTRSTTVITSSGGMTVSTLSVIEASPMSRSDRALAQDKAEQPGERERPVLLRRAAAAAHQDHLAVPELAQAQLIDGHGVVRADAGRAARPRAVPGRHRSAARRRRRGAAGRRGPRPVRP